MHFSLPASRAHAASVSTSFKLEIMSSDAAEPTMTSGFWFTEEVSPVMNISMKLDRITFDQKTKFQRAQIVETAPFGKTLVLDGKTQSALNDEFVYHESLVHPSMLAHPSPKRVFIGGGGELATAREVLKHSSVESCVMVDIDGAVSSETTNKVDLSDFLPQVVDICKSEMPEWAAGCTEDPRLTVVIDDAKAWLENTSEKFDVVIMDIADPIEAGPGIALYYTEFYKFVTSRMNPGGIFVTQSGPGSIMNYTECNTVIHNTLKHSFDHVVAYSSDVPSFGTLQLPRVPRVSTCCR